MRRPKEGSTSCPDQTALPSRLPGLLRPLALAQAHAWAAAVFVDELRPPQPAVLEQQQKIGFVSPIGCPGGSIYLRLFPLAVLRNRTPGPPPFSSMNSTPPSSNARRTATSLAEVIAVSFSVIPPGERSQHLEALVERVLLRSIRSSARAARICALMSGFRNLTRSFRSHVSDHKRL